MDEDVPLTAEDGPEAAPPRPKPRGNPNGRRGKPAFDGHRPQLVQVAGIDLQCTAMTRSGERCRTRVLPGWEVCHIHHRRLLATRGSSIPSYTSGRYSKLLPPNLQERYDKAAGDPELLKIEDEIRLVDARLQDLASRLDQGESGAMWRSVKSRLSEVLTLFRRRQYGEAVPTLMALVEDTNGALAEHALWDEMGRWVDRRKQLVESERRRLVELQQYVPAQRVQVMLSAIGSVIQTHVTDPATLAAIATGIGRVVNAGPRSTTLDSSGPAVPDREGVDDREQP